MANTTKYLLVILIQYAGLIGFSQQQMQHADSLFMEKDYPAAKKLYRQLLQDTAADALHFNRLGFAEYSTGDYENAERHFRKSLALRPIPPLKASIYSRLARTSAKKHNDRQAFDYLDSAISNGYLAIRELDTVKDFTGIRKDERFKQIRDGLYNALYPCMNDARAREFDFWIGEWDVFVSGTNTRVGHSLVQKVSGGCALLENWNSAVSEGKSLNYIDDSTKKWKQVWIGSYAAGKQDFTGGVYRDSAMVFCFTTSGGAGVKAQGRFSFFNQGPGKVRQLNELSADGGNTWTVQYDFTYLRKKPNNDNPH